MTYRAISADSHIIEPPHLWEKWLAPELRKFAPKLVKDHEGGDAWQYGEGMAPAPIGLVGVRRGRKYTDPDYKWTGLRIDQVNQGAFYGEPRLAEQDEDGVSAEVIYAPVRAAMHFMSPGNDEIARAGVQAYNNWLHQEFCAVAPNRLIGLALMPNIGIEGALAGSAAVLNPLVTMSTGAVADAPRLLAEMVYSGMFDRFPRLQMVFGEVNVGWVPVVLESMDDHYNRDRIWTKTELQRMPSTYWKTNFAATFIIDRFGIRNRDQIGSETIMWSTDYPHHRCDWLESQRIIAEHMQGVPAQEAAAMCAGNAARIYGIGA